MKKKLLSSYLDLMKSAYQEKDLIKEKRYREVALKNISKLSYLPIEEYTLYSESARAYLNTGSFSRALDCYYKSYLIAEKNKLAPQYSALADYGMGSCLLNLRDIKQALRQFKKVDDYYQKYSDNNSPMNKQRRFLSIILTGHAYFNKDDLQKLKEIIEQKLPQYQFLIPENTFIQYYHLKGEYLIAVKEYKEARESFNICIRVHEKFNDNFAGLFVKIHLAWIDALEMRLSEAITILERVIKEAIQLKFYRQACEGGLLLSKCYQIKKMPSKAALIEKKLRPILGKLDITWFYEKSRDFERLYQQMQVIYSSKVTTPVIFTNKLKHHYEILENKYHIIGKSPAMLEVYQQIEKIAPTDLPVLIQGETGSGKELIARLIHNNSLRREKFWLALNCSALPESLLETELFGYNKGSFTDAVRDHKGHIELASEGTLFLDEVSEMSPSMQQKLLRVMDEKLVWRVGSEKPIQVNTRFIFASNQNIEELVMGKRFREDLYYRINTIVIALPPLRERKEDIPLLIEYFLKKHYPKMRDKKEKIIEVSPEVISSLQLYSWPGNIRELENEIKRICILHPNITMITESIISGHIKTGITKIPQEYKDGLTLKEQKNALERSVITDTLRKYNNNITKTAAKLGCRRYYLQRKIKQYKIDKTAYFVTKK